MIQANDGSDIPISVHIVPKIAAPLQNLIPDPGKRFSHLRDLPLAHSVQAIDNFEISLLVGVDSYCHIVQDKVVCGYGLSAVEFKIKHFLSGPLSLHANAETIRALHVGISPFPTSDNNKQFWDVDFTSKLPPCSSELRIAEYIDSSVRRQSDGSYVVKFS